MHIEVKAVLVTFQTDVNRLDDILKILSFQCAVIVADNSSDEDHAKCIAACVRKYKGHYLSMGGNRGIASAQNLGIYYAWRSGAEAVLLLDDDSIPDDQLIPSLMVSVKELGSNAVVIANSIDGTGKEISHVRRVKGSLPKCREMRSSGTLIQRKVFERVGTFDESLFIDCVDFDWGWRAQQAGITLHVCRAAVITHQLGDGQVAGIRYPSPIRHYYQYRNILRMMLRAYTPWSWRLSQFFKLPIKLLLITALMPEKSRRLRYAFAGIRDFFLGRSGPLLDKPAS